MTSRSTESTVIIPICGGSSRSRDPLANHSVESSVEERAEQSAGDTALFSRILFSDSLPSLAYGCLFRPTTVRRFSLASQLHTYVCNRLRLRPPSRCRDRYIRVGRNPIGSSTFERLARPHRPADLLPLIGAIGYYLPMSPDITYRTVASERGALRSW